MFKSVYPPLLFAMSLSGCAQPQVKSHDPVYTPPLASATGNSTASSNGTYQEPAYIEPVGHRSLREFAHCDGHTDDWSAINGALALASKNHFTLEVDCPAYIHVGMDASRPVFLENNTNVSFSGNGRFIVDNHFIPAFILANVSHVRLEGWRIQYNGEEMADWNLHGYVENGLFTPREGYAQSTMQFNDATLKRWLSSRRNIQYEASTPTWQGPTNGSALFYIIGDTHDLHVNNMELFVAKNVGVSRFIPMAFSSIPSHPSNSVVHGGDIGTEIPHDMWFTNIKLDGYFMGWQGDYVNCHFEHIRAYRYGDLQDDKGGTVGGVKKWFAPPHLFYLGTRNIVINDVVDYGNREGIARDKAGEPQTGYANSLKIGAEDSVVSNYTSYRPDGLMDLKASKNLRLENIQGTYNSEFIHQIYPGIRFPSAPHQNVQINHLRLRDLAPSTTGLVMGHAGSRQNENFQLNDVHLELNHWDGKGSLCPIISGTTPDYDVTIHVNDKITGKTGELDEIGPGGNDVRCKPAS